MFLNATRINPNDPELHVCGLDAALLDMSYLNCQTVLGVLYHISNEFDKAIESFKNALRLKPGEQTALHTSDLLM